MKQAQIPAGALVFIGGGVGATLRYLATYLFADVAFPQTTLIINLLGAFLLGLLSGVLANSGTERARMLRLSVGTGIMGGFTTYSTFSLQSVQLIEQGKYILAIAYILLSLVFGALLCWVGFVLAEKSKGRRTP